jgi:hypothetical protein
MILSYQKSNIHIMGKNNSWDYLLDSDECFTNSSINDLNEDSFDLVINNTDPYDYFSNLMNLSKKNQKLKQKNNKYIKRSDFQSIPINNNNNKKCNQQRLLKITSMLDNNWENKLNNIKYYLNYHIIKQLILYNQWLIMYSQQMMINNMYY